ncbi:MAG: HD domain-containing phosphohydrolase, partial [Phycisphaerae bacterium]
LPGADLSEAMRLAHDLRDALRSDTVADGEHELRVTASFGVAELHASGLRDPGMLLHQADVALYEAKGAGRDRVVAARPSVAPASGEARSSPASPGAPTTTAESLRRGGTAAPGSRGRQGTSEADTFALMGCTFSFLRAMPDRQRVAHDLLHQVATVLQCRSASLLLLDETGKSLDPIAIVGPRGSQESADIRVPPELCRWLADRRTGESGRVGESADAGLFHLADPDNGETVVYLPLAVYDQVLGVLKATGLPANTDLSGSRCAVVQAICAIGAAAIRNCDLYARLEDRMLGSIKALAGAVEAALPRKQGHATRVSDLAVEIARAMGQRDEEALRSLRFAALLHDIGELTIPRGILEARRGLRKRDRDILEGHAAAGAAILEGIPELRRLAAIVRHHHEHHDGSGYPDGLAGTEIPFESVAIAVADAYDTMVSGQQDGRPLPHFTALRRILEGSGTRFAPSAVAALLKCHKAAQAMQQESVSRDEEAAAVPAAVVA